jgi:hypothetical protein
MGLNKGTTAKIDWKTDNCFFYPASENNRFISYKFQNCSDKTLSQTKHTSCRDLPIISNHIKIRIFQASAKMHLVILVFFWKVESDM